jgi:hypothetical protein
MPGFDLRGGILAGYSLTIRFFSFAIWPWPQPSAISLGAESIFVPVGPRSPPFLVPDSKGGLSTVQAGLPSEGVPNLMQWDGTVQRGTIRSTSFIDAWICAPSRLRNAKARDAYPWREAAHFGRLGGRTGSARPGG